jgi:D-lyxose ketol-isomerase
MVMLENSFALPRTGVCHELSRQEVAMKRSKINQILLHSEAFLESKQFFLPPFARWDALAWHSPEAQALKHAGLGWAITDFGFGEFEAHGATVFTLRNAALFDSVYCEKIIVLQAGQKIGHHYHLEKTEDVINRAGGVLEIQLASVSSDNQLDDKPVRVARDGVWTDLPSGTVLRLFPGESVTLLPRTSHLFFAPEGGVLMGEISSVNDDSRDNYFVFGVNETQIEEDAPPYRLLTRDYRSV